MFAEPLLAQNATTTLASRALTPSEASVHTSFAKILLKHMRKMQANPKHDPFKSGEVIAAYRMHADALQASGFNNHLTAAARSSRIQPITHDEMTKHFALLSKLGLSLDAATQTKVAGMVTSASAEIAPRLPDLLQTHTILKVQRSVHAQMVGLRLGKLPPSVSSSTLNVKTRVQQPVSHFMKAAYHPGTSHWMTAAFDDDGGDDGGDDGWGDGDGGGDGDGPGLLLPPGSGNGGSDGGGDDSYSNAYSAALIGQFTTPSGTTIQGCQAIYGLLSLAAGVGSIVGLGGDAVVGVVFGVTITAAALGVLLAVLAALWAYWAIFC